MITTVYEIPLSPKPQSINVLFPNGTLYNLRFLTQFNADACWLMDIADASSGAALVQGVPLVTGADLLAQYAYLGLGCSLWCSTDGGSWEPPQFWNLGISAHLWLGV